VGGWVERDVEIKLCVVIRDSERKEKEREGGWGRGHAGREITKEIFNFKPSKEKNHFLFFKTISHESICKLAYSCPH
jgi:hypothetical protein